MSWDQQDEDNARRDQSEARRRHKCQCGDMPGYCPGPVNCPLSDYADEPADPDDLGEE